MEKYIFISYRLCDKLKTYAALLDILLSLRDKSETIITRNVMLNTKNFIERDFSNAKEDSSCNAQSQRQVSALMNFVSFVEGNLEKQMLSSTGGEKYDFFNRNDVYERFLGELSLVRKNAFYTVNTVNWCIKLMVGTTEKNPEPVEEMHLCFL